MTFAKPTIELVTDLNDVNNENMQLTNKFLTFPVPLTTSAGNRISNVFGKTRVITITGRHYGDGYSGASIREQILAFVEEIEDWANTAGAQQRRSYTNIFGEEYKVACDTFTYNWRDTTPVHIEYTIRLIEGGNITNDVFEDLGV